MIIKWVVSAHPLLRLFTVSCPHVLDHYPLTLASNLSVAVAVISNQSASSRVNHSLLLVCPHV